MQSMSGNRLEGKECFFFLGEQSRRRPVSRPRPAAPSRRAPPRTDPPGVCPVFGFDKFMTQTDVFIIAIHFHKWNGNRRFAHLNFGKAPCQV